MDWDRIDWARLAELREVFLGEASRAGDYWRSRADLELYDATFGARIAWKWNAVLAELRERGGFEARGTLVDFGCGSGVASRAWIAGFGSRELERVWLVDRSAQAVEFAGAKLRELAPELAVEHAGSIEALAPDLLLVSHVLGELAEPARRELVTLARRSKRVLWVEPGARAQSRALGAVRDDLLDTFDVVAPCTHRERCGALAAGRERNWCHFFAAPSTEAFTERGWSLFARRLGIDLRALPYAFVALRARDGADVVRSDEARVLGRPRFERGRAALELCAASGLDGATLRERDDRARFATWKKRGVPRTVSRALLHTPSPSEDGA